MRILAFFVLLLPLSIAAAGQNTPSEIPQPSTARAHDLQQQGKLDEAIAMLQALASAQPPAKGIQRELGIAYYRSSRLMKAQEAFAAAIVEDPSDSESVQMEGLTYYRMGMPEKAIPYLERVHEWMPDADADSNYVLGLCYMNAGRFDEARKAFAQEFSIDAESASSYLLMGSMMMRANLPEAAAGQAQKALQLSPDLPLAHFMLGEVHLAKSDVEDALMEFEQERRLNPAYAAVYDRLGDVYFRVGKYQEAQQALTKAISLDVSSTGPFIQMGRVLLRQEDPTMAIKYLRHAEKMDPSSFMTHTLLAQAYRRVGQEEDAKREIDLASKVHADTQLTLHPIE